LRALHVDGIAAIRGIGLGGKPRDGDIDECGIGGCDSPVREGDLQCLGDQVDGVGRPKAHARHIETFEDIQHLRDMHAARCRWRRADDREPSVARRHRLTLHDCVLLQIGKGQRATVSSDVLSHGRAECAAVEQPWSFARKALQGSRVIRLHNPAAGRNGFATG
jgi:hypothetical protein